MTEEQRARVAEAVFTVLAELIMSRNVENRRLHVVEKAMIDAGILYNCAHCGDNMAIDSEVRTCDGCYKTEHAYHAPDWINGECTECDPDVLDEEMRSPV